MDIEHVLPQDIEKRSMQIIEEELGEVRLDPDKKDIIKRVIHTSADFEYAHKLRFSNDAVESALNAIRHGCT
ncbi:MAG: precorrin-8X methylmutase, partial [Megasphaera micronuciformis]|nr:precorrin-8X methylmutase [Megasphaera micronuciformis]